MWYEWRARGRGFVTTVALVLAALVTLAVLLERDRGKQANFGVMFLLTPMLLASVWAAYAGTAGVVDRSARLSAFAATRPLSNSAFVAAKFRAAGVAALASWAVVLVVFSAWLLYTGGYRELGRPWDVLVEQFGTARAVGFCALLVVGPLLITWRMLVVSMWAGLTGRAWVPVVQPIVTALVGLQLLSEWIMWNADPVRRERIMELLPWAVGAAVVLKVLVGWWASATLLRRKELEPGALAKLLGAWVVGAASLFALLVWLVPADQVPRYGLALGAVLAVPFTRLAVAPIAFAWNRHR